jgi:hypothetical protein
MMAMILGSKFTGAGPPPAPNNTANWNAGGIGPGGNSMVQRITFATDTATASIRGPLSYLSSEFAATSTSTNAWFAAGRQPAAVYQSTVSRITFATDTATSVTTGPLSREIYRLASIGSPSYGYFGGGQAPPAVVVSTINRIDYSNDAATASVRGPLTQPTKLLGSTSDNTTYGWWAGGYLSSPAPNNYSTVARTVYATDTATATTRGPLSASGYFVSGAGNENYGWFSIGVVLPAGVVSIISRITYANDTATGSTRGPLSPTRTRVASSGNNNYGWWSGGYAPGNVTTVSRVDYANDTVATSTRGPLAAPVRSSTSAAGIQ